MHGQEGGSTGIDDEFAERGFENIGAWIIGRNMFGPVRSGIGSGESLLSGINLPALGYELTVQTPI